ncbi:MAG TPA: nitronate monooxygenase [Actinomycetota bacterium]|nr:nitronate monooxygenase [Actinomycetota bacterium]
MAELRTPLCRSLGIEYPILSVGFGISAGPELVSAVSNAGGCGVLGASSGQLPIDELRRRVRRCRELTDRPFGINFLIMDFGDPEATDEDRAWTLDRFRMAIEERVPVVVLFWGDSSTLVEEAHRGGMTALVQVGTVAEARAAAEAGADAIIAQGVEAGGHVRGTTSIWDVLPAVIDAVDPLPVLASGGIGDGAGIARALGLGAQGVSMGTRFVASEEAWVHETYKRRVVDAKPEDTFYGQLFDAGWPAPARALKNAAFRDWEAAGSPPSGSRPGEDTDIGVSHFEWGDTPFPRYAPGMLTPAFDGDPEYGPMWAGESVGAINDLKPAGDIMRDLVRETTSARGGTR